MTRDEFIEGINDWYDLIEFCDDNGCHVCEDVFSKESLDEYVDERMVEWAREVDSWEELADVLDRLPRYDGYFVKDEYEDFSELGENDLDSYKYDVLTWADEEGVFDDEEEADISLDDISLDMDSAEEELEKMIEENDPDKEYEVGNEEISLGELFSLKGGDVQWI